VTSRKRPSRKAPCRLRAEVAEDARWNETYAISRETRGFDLVMMMRSEAIGPKGEKSAYRAASVVPGWRLRMKTSEMDGETGEEEGEERRGEVEGGGDDVGRDDAVGGRIAVCATL
jgi:hypothetical protein